MGAGSFTATVVSLAEGEGLDSRKAERALLQLIIPFIS